MQLHPQESTRVKAVDRGMVIGEIRLEEKRGGRSGEWRRQAGAG